MTKTRKDPKRRAELWSLPDCAACDQVAVILAGLGYQVERQVCQNGDWKDFLKFPDRDEIMAQLQMQEGAFPLVRVGGKFVHPVEVIQGWN